MNKIIIYKDTYLYKDKWQTENEFEKIIANIHKSIDLILMAEPILIYSDKIDQKSVYEYIVDYKKQYSLDGDNGLIHWNYNKKNKSIYIYSLKGSKIISKIGEVAKKMKVSPIQFLVVNYLLKNKKRERFQCVFKTYKEYYMVVVKDRNIVKSYVYDTIQLLIENFHSYEMDEDVVYIEKGLEDKILITKNEKEIFHIGRIYEEKFK